VKHIVLCHNIKSGICTIKAKTTMVRTAAMTPRIAGVNTSHSTMFMVLLTSQTQLCIWHKAGYMVFKAGYDCFVLRKRKLATVVQTLP